MAKNIVVTEHLTDDLDGGKADRTVTFTFDGTNYELELSAKNATGFEKAMRLFTTHARTVTPARRVRPRVRGGQPVRDMAAVRRWARENGFELSDRGRVAKEVLAAYDDANQ